MWSNIKTSTLILSSALALLFLFAILMAPVTAYQYQGDGDSGPCPNDPSRICTAVPPTNTPEPTPVQPDPPTENGTDTEQHNTDVDGRGNNSTDTNESASPDGDSTNTIDDSMSESGLLAPPPGGCYVAPTGDPPVIRSEPDPPNISPLDMEVAPYYDEIPGGTWVPVTTVLMLPQNAVSYYVTYGEHEGFVFSSVVYARPEAECTDATQDGWSINGRLAVTLIGEDLFSVTDGIFSRLTRTDGYMETSPTFNPVNPDQVASLRCPVRELQDGTLVCQSLASSVCIYSISESSDSENLLCQNG